MKLNWRKSAYLLSCAAVLALWIAFGSFEAIEAPYVGF